MYHPTPPNVDTAAIEGIPGALPSKTPVSLLQELCMRRGISPKYDLLQIEGAVHEPTFVYRVTVGEFAANGSGQSKKKAKHAAAKAVLDIIIQGGAAGAGGPSAGGAAGAAPELSTQIVSPYDDGIPGNPVGSLQELCMARRWPPPTYELTSEEGFPHERTFSIACTIGNTREIGTGKSKKLAKRQAAFKMSQRLKDQPVEQPPVTVLTDDDEEVLNLDTHDTQSEEYLSLTETEKKTDGSVNYVSLARVCRMGLESLKIEDSDLEIKRKCKIEKD
ncbi:RISC-loading complex subunit tarbp2-like isoform X3 [Portunus trituberculatus]|uniref:RISC-loading complex subunit tarbp2-like isoform X3 n=1 Tax=Portunus trituberculatus TaxID=210409 RepID=UPI001E1D0BB8|nr:RISC-loading complex subunit tarbp2-like isoform X3 [Portunus trituberculatus]